MKMHILVFAVVAFYPANGSMPSVWSMNNYVNFHIFTGPNITFGKIGSQLECAIRCALTQSCLHFSFVSNESECFGFSSMAITDSQAIADKNGIFSKVGSTSRHGSPDFDCPQCTEQQRWRPCEERIKCKLTREGHEYRGCLSVTAEGIECQPWNRTTPHSHKYLHLESNYCRNPDNDLDGPWCYTMDPKIRWRFCSIPFCGTCPAECSTTNCENEPGDGCFKCHQEYYGRYCEYRTECKFTSAGQEYRGQQSVTKKGLECQHWSKTTPHNHEYLHLESNYCRNFDNFEDGPWCFTLDPYTRWDQCSIPSCDSQCTAPPLQAGAKIINPAHKGVGFYEGYVLTIECEDGSLTTTTCNSQKWSQITCSGMCPPGCSTSNCKTEFNDECPQCKYGFYGRQCEHRIECKHTSKGAEYIGRLSKTVENIACRFWNDTTFEKHPFTNYEFNNCRNPENVLDGPWCFTSDPVTRWQYCSVPACSSQCTAPGLPAGAKVLNPASIGIGFYEGFELSVICANGNIATSVCNSQTWSAITC